MDASKLISDLKSVSLKNVFNPYADICHLHDRPLANEIRSEALARIFESARSVSLHSLWVGRDLGYRGGRRTGLAFTDDRHYLQHLARWGHKFHFPTHGEAVSEATAGVIWRVLGQIDAPVFLWNLFPFHPYNPSSIFSNRKHMAIERKVGAYFLKGVCEALNPSVVVGIGADAARYAASILGHERVVHLRHPSFGGATQFSLQARDLYEI